MNEILIEHMAKVGFETMYEESWHDVRTFGIEGDLWRKIARNMLEVFMKENRGIEDKRT